ncbi:MAG: alpha/beta hydrolase [Blastocatellia bacterium]
MKIAVLMILSFVICTPAHGQTPFKVTGEGIIGGFWRYEKFASKIVDARNVDVWLPANYSQDKKYAVLYMHDGQNLFNPKESYGGVDWGIDETMTRLITEKKIRDTIVVGVWNTPKRFEEYMPQKAFEMMNVEQKEDVRKFNKSDRVLSDNYLKFLVTELKPFIDKTYSTKQNAANTFVMGSSMGGLISLYAISEYPEVFGGAGCVSTHFPIGKGVVIDYMAKYLSAASTRKIYFDYGTETLDAIYEPYQLKADEVMKVVGFIRGKNWITQKFQGEEHSEKSWRKRVDVPLVFLLAK